MPVLETKGALSAQGYGLTTTLPQRVYVEDVFSTWLYTGNNGSQAIGNGIQLGAGATSPGWATTLSPIGATGSIEIDSAGNVYSCVTFSNAIQITKFNSTGVIQWQRSLSGASNTIGNGVAVDSSGNVYVCGEGFVSTNRALQIAKYDSSGSLLWQRTLGGSIQDRANAIALDSSNNIYICGYSRVSSNTALQIAKYDTNGNIQWQRRLASSGTNSTLGYGVAIDISSNIYITGNSNVSTNNNILTAKYNSSGVIQWQRALAAASGSDIGYGIAVDGSGNAYVSAISGSNAFQLVKYDTNGTVLWQRTVTPSGVGTAYSVSVDSSANVYACGFEQIAGVNRGLIVKYDTSGTLLWQRYFYNNDNVNNLDISSIKSDNSGNIYIQAGFNSYVVAKLPADGSGLGVYYVGSQSFAYVPSSLTSSATTLTASTPTFTDSASTLTDAASSLTSAASSLTSSTTALAEGPGKGGLVWMKGRSGATDNALYDTARGATFDLASNLSSGQTTQSTGLTGFLANGFSIGSLAKINTSAATYVSWTFREQPRFFDIVTYTGNGANRTIAHSLESVPGCIIVKRTDAAASWQVYHRSVGNTQYMVLDSTALPVTNATIWNNTTPTATEFSLGTSSAVNASGGTYVAYLFAHDAGGFGNSGGDNVISCGSYTGNGSVTGPTVTLGYEPQWLLVKSATGTAQSWYLIDNMRGFTVAPSNNLSLRPNTNNAELTNVDINPTATGFSISGTSLIINASGETYIYIAIRRGPMRTPTSGTSVFSPIVSSAVSGTKLTTNFPVDTQIKTRTGATSQRAVQDRLRRLSTNSTASGLLLYTNAADAESSDSGAGQFFDNTGFMMPPNDNSVSTVFWNFRRAPGFFDVVCYTGNGASSRRVPANLAAVPQFVIVKSRSSVETWSVGTPYTVSPGLSYSGLRLNSSAAQGSITVSYLYSAPPYVDLGVPLAANTNGVTYVAYAFASCPGVSSVGTYTGTGSTQTINCGFTAGARFVLIKRTDATGDWYVWDTARGIVAANDPYLVLNSIAAEVTNTDWVDTAASGFELSNAAGNLVNTNGGQYIFLAIA